MHASYVDLAGVVSGEPTQLDTQHLLGALGELASRQAEAPRETLWRLRPHVPASESDAESLAGFTPAFTPSASTPREPHTAYERAAGSGGPGRADAGRWASEGAAPAAAQEPPPRSGSGASAAAALRDAAQRHRGAAARPAACFAKQPSSVLPSRPSG
jgi:hypothetical protein